MKPAVFFTGGTFLAVRQELRPDIPVVFASIAADPIEYGLAQSYAKPGGKFTGHVLNALGGEEASQKSVSLTSKSLFQPWASLVSSVQGRELSGSLTMRSVLHAGSQSA